MHMRTALQVEMEIASLLPSRCVHCGSDTIGAVKFETKAGIAVIEAACPACGLYEATTLDWNDVGLNRCPVCQCAFPTAHPVTPASFDWPRRCRHCRLRFVDARYPYKLRVFRPEGESRDLTFSRKEQFEAALLWCERTASDHWYRGPHWHGGSMRMSEKAIETWNRATAKPCPSEPSGRVWSP
jgi:hypothetical protein